MNEINILEIIGYVASAIIATSVMMNSLLKLRWLNLVGASMFVVYGFVIGALPVAFLNSFTAITNVFYLVRLSTRKELFKILEVNKNSNYLKHFLDFHKKEISKFIPDFNFVVKENTIGFYLLRDLIPAGLFLGEKIDNESFVIFLDYVIPEYRDLKLGKFLYVDSANFFKEQGYKKLYSYAGAPAHKKYLEKMGFVPSTRRKECLMKIL
ncbi:YgjV family protein [candidate division KSB1 bacterium]|nr:YgjV family protein [candidate division KSB1 bacterium]